MIGENFVKNKDIKTIEDYVAEYKRAAYYLQGTDSVYWQRVCRRYMHELAREIKDYDRFRGTDYGRFIK